MTTTIIKRKKIDEIKKTQARLVLDVGEQLHNEGKKAPKGFLEGLIKSAEKVETATILVDIQRAIDELRSEENGGYLSDVLLANARAQAILENVLKKFETTT